MKRKDLKIFSILLFILLGVTGSSYAQVFPIQINSQIAPPYTPYLADYTAPGTQKLMLQVRSNDPLLNDYRVKLRITIEGVNITIRTKPSFIPQQPILIEAGGVPQLYYGEDLAEYFSPNALDFAGITRSQYEKGAKLPEGLYRFTIELLDYHRGTVISNKTFSMAWIILNDPPLLNLPRKDSKLRIVDPTNVAFTWTPRHTGSPNAAFSTEYKFRLVEIWPATRNPYDAFLTQPALYETTTSETQIIYGPAEPALIPGRKYAWQVQATDTEGRDLFKNQGRSEVYVFQFGDALGIPENVRLQSANPSGLNVRWDQSLVGSTDPVQYRVRYRPKKKTNDQWYEAVAQEQWRALSLLQPDTEYEVQVRAEQLPQISEYSGTQIFKTLPAGANQFVCKDDVPLPPTPAATFPTSKLSINDTIHAGGYDVLVREVTGEGNKYSGRGVAIVPWFNDARVRVTFEKIGVNNQFWLTSGEIKTVWDANSKFLMKVEGQTSPGGVTPQAGEIPVTIVATDSLIQITGAAIVSVTKDAEGNIVVQTSDGQSRTLEKGESYSITDEVGNGYVIDKDGNIVKTTATEAMAANARGNRNYEIKLRFEKGEGTFGFDEKKYDALAQNYQQIEGGEFTAWKAVSSSEPDKVSATSTSANVDQQKVKFELNNAPATATLTGSTFSISLTGKAEGTVEELLAYNDESKAQVIGKLNVVSYNKLTRKVVLVPVNNNKYPGSIDDLKKELNKIYSQAVVEWTVAEGSNIDVTLSSEFDDGESGLLSNYTDDMKKVINAYTQNHSLANDTYYLFLVAKPKSKDKLGYMPRKKQAGFIFVDNVAKEKYPANTIAHELGHGAFRLEHTFDEYPALSKGTTDNLMDYGSGAALYKYQWDNVHNPEAVIGLFEDDEAGAHIGIPTIPDELRNSDRSITCISPAGKLVLLPPSANSVVFYNSFSNYESSYPVTGTLYSFKTDKGEFVSNYSNTGAFDGYYDIDSKARFENWQPTDEQVKLDAKSSVVMLIPCDRKANLISFSVSNVEIDDFKSTKFISERDFPLKPFTINMEGSRVPYSYGYQDRFADPAGFIASPACESKAILPTLKSLYLRLVYQGEMSFFDNNYIAGQEPQAVELKRLKETDAVEYEYRYLEILREYLERRISENQNLLNNLSATSSQFQWKQIIDHLTYEEFQRLTLSQRVTLIRLSTRETIYGDTEHKVRNLITTTPDKDQPALLDSLIKTKDFTGETLLLKGLIRDWSGLDGNDFGQVLSAMTGWVQIHSPAPASFTRDYAINNKKVVHFNPGFWFGDFLTEEIRETGKMYFETTSLSETNILEVGPYEWIYIRFDDDFKLGNVLVKEGQALPFPALYAYLLFNNENTSRLLQAGQLALDITLFATGLGEVRAAITAGKYTWRTYKAVADIGFAVADFTFRNTLQTKAEKSKELQSFLESWSHLMIYYSVLSVSSDVLTGIAGSMRRQADDMISKGYVTDELGNQVPLTQTEKQEIIETVASAESKLGIIQTGESTWARYSKVDTWLASTTDVAKRAEIENVIKTWSDDLLTKLDNALLRSAELANDFTQNVRLLSYFKEANTSWWFKYGLLREHYSKSSLTLPPSFRNVVESLEDVNGTKLATVINNTTAGNEISVMAGLFENDVIHYIGQGFRTGNFSHLPPNMKLQLEYFYSNGYKVMVTQPNLDLSAIGSTNAQPDILFFKVRGDNTINFNSVIYPDAKIDLLSNFTDRQAEFISIIGSGKTVTLNKFVSSKNPQIFQPANSSLQLSDFINQNISLTEAGKLSTKFQNDVVEFIYQKYK